MSTTMTRPVITDDSGDGDDGLIINAAWVESFCLLIDAIFAGALSIGGSLTMTGVADLTGVKFTATADGRPSVSFWNVASGNLGELWFANDGGFEIRRKKTSNLSFINITAGGVISTVESIQIGGSAARGTTAGTNRLDIFNGTAPVGTLTNGISLYSASGECRVMDAAGNSTLLSPHDSITNEWIYHSKHTPTGKVLRIPMERLVAIVEQLSGERIAERWVEPVAA